MKIKETIIVEGRDDTAAIKRSVDALTIETHGYGIRQETWELIARAEASTGIIVFTDPDHAGEKIRKRITERFPSAGQAFLDRDAAEKNGDIGVENADPENIREALRKARVTQSGEEDAITADMMFGWGLSGMEESGERRKELGKLLGIGNCNSRTFLRRLNNFGIGAEEVEEALRKI